MTTPTPQRRLDARDAGTPTVDEKAQRDKYARICPTCDGDGSPAYPFDGNCPAEWAHRYLATLPAASAEPTGEAVAWAIFDRFGRTRVDNMSNAKASSGNDVWIQERLANLEKRGKLARDDNAPYTLRALYAHPLPASPRREAVEAAIGRYYDAVHAYATSSPLLNVGPLVQAITDARAALLALCVPTAPSPALGMVERICERRSCRTVWFTQSPFCPTCGSLRYHEQYHEQPSPAAGGEDVHVDNATLGAEYVSASGLNVHRDPSNHERHYAGLRAVWNAAKTRLTGSGSRPAGGHE